VRSEEGGEAPRIAPQTKLQQTKNASRSSSSSRLQLHCQSNLWKRKCVEDGLNVAVGWHRCGRWTYTWLTAPAASSCVALSLTSATGTSVVQGLNSTVEARPWQLFCLIEYMCFALTTSGTLMAGHIDSSDWTPVLTGAAEALSRYGLQPWHTAPRTWLRRRLPSSSAPPVAKSLTLVRSHFHVHQLSWDGGDTFCSCCHPCWTQCGVVRVHFAIVLRLRSAPWIAKGRTHVRRVCCWVMCACGVLATCSLTSS